MADKFKPSDEERNLFREAIGNVDPIKHDKHKPHRSKVKVKKHSIAIKNLAIPATKHTSFEAQDCLDQIAKDDWLGAQDCIHFARGGLQKRAISRLQRGQMAIEGRLDLHRLNANEALQRVDTFIENAQRMGKRCVCIVHGKGHYSADAKPILKNVLNVWLRKHPQVLACQSATPKDGGTGAVYVLLKVQRGSS